MGKIEVRILTERKVIDARPGVLRGSPLRIEVDVCVVCGAIVFDVFGHDRWHQSLAATPEKEK